MMLRKKRFLLIVWVGLLSGLAFFASSGVRASKESVRPTTVKPVEAAAWGPTTIQAAQRGNPWINLRDGRELATSYTGALGLESLLTHGLARPTALASADFDEDGVPDLVSGYVGPGGGLITLHRGNLESIFPRQRVNESMGSLTPLPVDPLPFQAEARVFEVEAAPDFLGAGDFDNDGHGDVVVASRGGEALYLLPGDGTGGLTSARHIPLPGAVTVLVTGEINRRDGLEDVIVGIVGSDGPQVLVFESAEGALSGTEAGAHGGTPGQVNAVGATVSGRPLWTEAFALPAAVTALALGQLDDSYEMDLVIAAGTELVLVHGRDRRLSLAPARQAEVQPAHIEQRSFPFSILSLAVGDFLWDEAHQTDLALLFETGDVSFVAREATEPQPGSKRDAHRLQRSHMVIARPSTSPLRQERHITPDGVPIEKGDPIYKHIVPDGTGPTRAQTWQVTSTIGVLTAHSLNPSPSLLRRAQVSSHPMDDLLVLNQSNHQLHILSDLRPAKDPRPKTEDQRPRTTDHGPRTTDQSAIRNLRHRRYPGGRPAHAVECGWLA